MAHELHLDITNYGAGTYDPVAGTLNLREAGIFTVEIREYKAEMAEIKRQRAVPGQSDAAKAILVKKEKEIRDKYAGVCWIYKETGVFPHVDLKSFSVEIPKGTLSWKFNFPKVLEGAGGSAYIEAYFHNPILDEKTKKMVQCYPAGKAPFGCFISALGKQDVLGAQWKDAKGHNIGTQKVAYGSTVYLYIYTQGLYGADLNILLHDRFGTQADLTISGSSTDFKKYGSKEHTNRIFPRKVSKMYFDNKLQPLLNVPNGTVKGTLGNSGRGIPVKSTCFQTCVVKVFVDYNWKGESAGLGLDNGSTLEIYPKVYVAGIGGQTFVLDKCVLNVSLSGATYKHTELMGNSPVLIDNRELVAPKDDRKRIDFTFGIFIDGTLNNMYNTEAREAFEKRTGKIARSQEDVLKYDKNEKKYRYRDIEDSSYENGLSNPAILYKNYTEDNSTLNHKRYRIYTGGIGTLTKPDENEIEPIVDSNGNRVLDPNLYKDDKKLGFIFGTDLSVTLDIPFMSRKQLTLSNTGIRDKVRDTVKAMFEHIEYDLENTNATIGIITIDIFGFSRGAAAARHFVDDIKAQAYELKTGIFALFDRQGYALERGHHPPRTLPKGGYFGLLMAAAGHTYDNVVIRFAGLYDTVPHHGLFQDDDVAELGLENINKAEFVVHLVADDEHRANFTLVDIANITGHKGGGVVNRGVELYLPGVHCDVGGAYVEGRHEDVEIIDSSLSYKSLAAVRDGLIERGWFTLPELHIRDWEGREHTDSAYVSNALQLWLSSTRSYLSNQYSYIPLRMMFDFCVKKSVPLSRNLKSDYSFKDLKTIKGNMDFLKRIEEKMQNYAFHRGKKFTFDEVELYETSHNTINHKSSDVNEDGNKYIKFLRNHYLHWNATYSSQHKFGNYITQPYRPRKEKGIPKRKIICTKPK